VESPWSGLVPAYNRERVSEEFRQLADLADAVFRANLRNLSADPGAVRAHDELLARSCVFGYLYDRHFLFSPELLLNELRWLKAVGRPEPPGNSLHPHLFVAHRDGLLDMLVLRFQSMLDYRDEIVAVEVPPPPAQAPTSASEPATEGESLRQPTARGVKSE
jgi:hypothetical protein